jgi:hypothetical protein
VVFAIVSALLGALVDALSPRASLVVEILVLRQQLAVLKRARPRPPLRPIDRASGSSSLAFGHDGPTRSRSWDRPHMGLDGDAPVSRAVEPRGSGRAAEGRRPAPSVCPTGSVTGALAAAWISFSPAHRNSIARALDEHPPSNGK